MKIYTKHGDDGSTGLFGGARISKSSLRIGSYGTVDELNSVIGVARTLTPEKRTDEILHHIQHSLFNLGAELATDPGRAAKSGATVVTPAETKRLEQWIDELDAQLPPLTAFILPGGSPCGAQLHVARTVCRRAERLTVQLSATEPIGSEAVVFLNRLSDLLFVLARFENTKKNKPEEEWKK